MLSGINVYNVFLLLAVGLLLSFKALLVKEADGLPLVEVHLSKVLKVEALEVNIGQIQAQCYALILPHGNPRHSAVGP